MIKLSNRLASIASKVPKGSRLADIGSDHALLPVYLVQQEIVTYAIAGEVNPGPFEAAKNQVNQSGYVDRIAVRKGDGLSVLGPGEVDVINIAGMGGALIAHILMAGKDKLGSVQRLILQPNVGAEFVRQWLLNNDWFLESEQILEEDGHIYEILTAVRKDGIQRLNTELYSSQRLDKLTVDKKLLLKLGPYLIKEASPVFLMKWREELDKLNNIISSVKRSEAEEARQKADLLQQERSAIKEVIDCLQKDRT